MSSDRLPKGYRQTEIGVIPEEWEVGKLDDYLSFISYGFTNPMPVSDSGVFMITAANISDGEIQYSTARRTTEAAYQTLLTSKSKPRKDDVLLTKDGTLGRVAVVGERRICINQSVAVIRPNEKILPQFLKLLLESPKYQQKMLEDAGGTTIRHIYITVVNLMPIAVPPNIGEQRSIAQALSDVDALIASLDKLIAKKRYLKTATMQQLLTGKKRLPGFGEGKGHKQTEIGVIPDDWVACSIQDLVSEGIIEKPLDGNHGNIHPKSSDYVYFGIPFIMSNDVHDGVINTQNCHFISKEQADKLRKGFSFEGDVLLTHKGTVGNVAIVPSIPTEYLMLTPQVTYYRVKDFSKLINVFMKFYFESSHFQSKLEQLSGGGTRAYIGIVGQRQLPFVLPPVEEQRAIATVLSDMDTEITALEARRTKTQALKQGMMQELLTGRTRLV